MSFLTNARKALGGKTHDDDYERYDDEMYDGDEEQDDAEESRGLFSFLSKKSYNSRKDDDDYESYDDNDKYSPQSSYKSRNSYDSSYKRNYSSNSYSSSPSSGNYKAEVVVMYPTDFDKSTDIVKSVKAGKITVFDVSQIESVDVARRVVDYICGAAEGMDCPFSKLCPSIFCIAPKGVKLTNPNHKFR